MFGQPRARQLAAKDPQTDERADCDERAEARDLERTDPEQNGVDGGLLFILC
jgi:hypothetical protein